MEQLVENKQVAIIQNSIEIFKTAPEVLKANQERTNKAKMVGESILTQWHEAWSIEDEDLRLQALAAADERSNKFLVNCATALTEEKELRAGITQLMDAFKKMFTEAEYELDKTKSNTVTSKVQNNRDTYVAEIAKIQERKRKEAERIAAKAKELIDIKAAIESSFLNGFNDYLLRAKQWLTGQFNDLSFDHFADQAAQIRLYEPVFKQEAFNKLTADINVNGFLHTKEEVAAIAAEIKSTLFDRFSEIYSEEMTALKKDLVDKIPSKHEEVKEAFRLEQEAKAEAERQRLAEEERQKQIAAANAKQKAKLEEDARVAREAEAARMEALRKEQEKAEEERKRREAEEAARLQKEAEEARLKAEAEAEAKKAAEQTLVLFEQEAAVSEVSGSAPAARQGYEIVVLHPVGFMRIFAFWFEKEGKNLPVDKIGNTKLDQMKTWCEKHAHKTGEKIEDKFLRYDETFKAINKK